MPELSKRRQRQLKAQGYDLAFLSRIQPQGNIDFKKDDRSWMSGDERRELRRAYEVAKTLERAYSETYYPVKALGIAYQQDDFVPPAPPVLMTPFAPADSYAFERVPAERGAGVAGGCRPRTTSSRICSGAGRRPPVSGLTS